MSAMCLRLGAGSLSRSAEGEAKRGRQSAVEMGMTTRPHYSAKRGRVKEVSLGTEMKRGLSPYTKEEPLPHCALVLVRSSRR